MGWTAPTTEQLIFVGLPVMFVTALVTSFLWWWLG